MRKLPIYLLALTTLAIVMPRPTTLAQDKPPGTAPAPAPTTKPAETKDGLIAELNLKDIPLADVVDFMRDADPTFQAVVSFAPGVQRNDIIIQELRLKNVTAASVLEVLCNAYAPIQAEKDAHGIWSIHVEADERADSVDSTVISTSTHRLRQIINDLVQSQGVDRKKALESVLSLITTVIEIDGPVRNTRLQLHEATETLIFRGDANQNQRVASALGALEPDESEKLLSAEKRLNIAGKEAKQFREERDRLTKELAEARAELAKFADQKEIEKNVEQQTLRESAKKAQTNPAVK